MGKMSCLFAAFMCTYAMAPFQCANAQSKDRPRNEVASAKAAIERVHRAKSTSELLKGYSNDTALVLGLLMLTTIRLAAKGISGPSTAGVRRPDPVLSRELVSLLSKYGIPESPRSRADGQAIERVRPKGRRFASDVYQLGVRAMR